MLVLCLAAASAYVTTPAAWRTRVVAPRVRLHLAESGGEAEPEPSRPEETQVGSGAYYRGFLSTPLEDNRGDGTEQALKLGAGAAACLGVLLLGFLASNGLLSVPPASSAEPMPAQDGGAGPSAFPLALYVAAFSATHIGLSALRGPIIEGCGSAASALRLVGRGVTLPDFWLGDSSGNQIWPDEASAGRQIFRVGYSLVATASLLGAFGAFQACHYSTPPALALGPEARAALVAVASAAQGISLASLLNPSPLSLVPGFEASSAAPLGLARDDSLKLRPYGLTRVTRHPLILPVVPWGLANAALGGGRPCDVVLGGGLALYAILGCYAQDLRAEASAAVGTPLREGADLSAFYDSTSFAPFGALLDGRQRVADVRDEVSWASLAVGCAAGWALEAATLAWLDG